jgi:hypothetical protein
MKRLLLLLLVTSSFFGCQKEYFERIENNITGTWVFDRAQERVNEPFEFYYSILNRYRGDELTFLSDKTVIYREGNGDILEGIWTITSIEGDNNGADYTISFALVDENGKLSQHVWSSNFVNRHCMNVYENRPDYEYQYRLSKR